MDRKYSKFLTVLLIIIIIAVIGLAGYLGYNYYKDYKTSSDANQFVSGFVEEVGDTDTTNSNTEGNTESLALNIEGATVSSSGNKTKTYKGFNVIGTIQIPKTNVDYPILEAPPTSEKLEAAVVALYPRNAEVNKPGNIVIVGHNYRNNLFFSNNKKLVNGDKINITDLNGNKVTYIVYNVFQTSQGNTEFYNRDTDGAMEITLSTCTDASNDQRLIVFARAE